MRLKANIIGFCLLGTFVLIFGSVMSLALFSAAAVPTSLSVESVATPEVQ